MAERFTTPVSLFKRILNITMTYSSFPLRALAFSGALLLSAHACAQQPIKFKVASLSAGIHLIKAEVAESEAEREQGLMFREKMGTNEGMVFLFGAPAGVCMWMKNTLLPLSVAFLDDDGKIINIEDMKPQTTESHCGLKPVRYALEMNAGWFKQKNIKAGMVIDGLPKAR
ncbi:MAG: uncharacterized membrane protein (UPF0127 family) [Bradyrhizobium sp.]|jgi:uncharacterized membrane protein (UPF0127 family)